MKTLLTYVLIFLCFAAVATGQSSPDTTARARDSLLTDSLYQLVRQQYASQPDAAKGNAWRMIEVAKRAGLLTQAGTGLRMLGIISQIQGRLDSSLIYYDAALEVIGATPAPKLRAGLYNSIGITYEELKDFPAAHANLRRALATYGSTEPQAWLGNVTLNIGNVFLLQEKIDSSLHYYGETRRYLATKSPPDTTALIGVVYQEGKVYHNTGQRERAVEKYQEALAYARANGSTYTQMTVLNGLIVSYLRLERLDVIDPLLDEHQRLAQEIESVIGQYVNEVMRYERDTIRNDWRSANTHYERAVAFQDSLSGLELQKKIAELENSYENREKARNIAELTRENETVTQLNQTQRRHSVMLCIIVGLLLCIAGLLWSRYRAAERERAIVTSKSEEKTLLLHEIHHRAKNNLSTIEGLLNLQLDEITTADATAALNRSRERIQAIGLIHEQLTYSDSAGNIPADTYLRNLVTRLRADQPEVDVQMDIPHILLDLSLAVPLGLVINEAVSNSLEHAVPAARTAKSIRVDLQHDPAGEYLDLVVEDNGQQATTAPAARDHGGLFLIRGLVAQLGGTVNIDFRGNTSLRARIPYLAPDTTLVT